MFQIKYQNKINSLFEKIKNDQSIYNKLNFIAANCSPCISAKDAKRIYNYRTEGMNIKEFRDVIGFVRREQRRIRSNKRKYHSRGIDVLAEKKNNTVFESLESFKSKKNKLYEMLVGARNIDYAHGVASSGDVFFDGDCYYLFNLCEDVDWDYYSKSYGFPKVTKTRTLSIISIPEISLKTQTSYSSLEKTVVSTIKIGSIKNGIKILKDKISKNKKAMKLIQLTQAFYLKEKEKEKILRFMLLDFSA